MLSVKGCNEVDGIQDIEAAREPYGTIMCKGRKTGWKVATAVVQRTPMLISMANANSSAPARADQAANFGTEMHRRLGLVNAACDNGVLLLVAVENEKVCKQ